MRDLYLHPLLDLFPLHTPFLGVESGLERVLCLYNRPNQPLKQGKNGRELALYLCKYRHHLGVLKRYKG